MLVVRGVLSLLLNWRTRALGAQHNPVQSTHHTSLLLRQQPVPYATQ